MPTMEERFWAKVVVRGPDDCWEWQGSRGFKGHGRFYVDKSRGVIGAHVIAYELAHGGPPPSGCALHSCDNPPCCNERHLFDGTRADNMADRWAKGRKGNMSVPHPNMRGQTKTPEHRQHMSESITRWHAERRASVVS